MRGIAGAMALLLVGGQAFAQKVPEAIAHPPPAVAAAKAQIDDKGKADALHQAAEQALRAIVNAEKNPQADPRMAGAAIQALSGVLMLREAELRALADDMNAKMAEREKQWSDYFAAYAGLPPKTAKADDTH